VLGHSSLAAIDAQSQQDLLLFLHAACFSPAHSTWEAAIKRGFFQSWPILNSRKLPARLPPSIATAKGHLDQTRQNLRSTRQPATPDPATEQPAPTERTHTVFAALELASPITGKVYSDQTGNLERSAGGHHSILVFYDYDSNAILAEPLLSKTSDNLTRAIEKIYSHLTSCGCKPKLHLLDNEASLELKKYLALQGVTYQLTPPNVHRRNAAERAIRTFKNHLIAGLSSTHKFPSSLWHLLIPQATITLNLMRPANLNNRLSAYAYLNGPYDYNRNPMAPPGTKVLIHEKPTQRRSWSPHGVEGWYVGPAMEHYRCYTCYVPRTQNTRISDTVAFFHHRPLPALSSADKAMRAAVDLTDALRNPTALAPFLSLSDTDMEALTQLNEIFRRNITPDASPPGVGTTAGRSPGVRAPGVPTPGAAPPHTSTLRTRSSYPPGQPLEDIDNYPPALTRRLVEPSYAGATTPATPVAEETTNPSMEYRHLITGPDRIIWNKSCANEFGRLAQGIRDIPGTDTIHFIPRHRLPPGRKPTYARYVCCERPQKTETHRTRVTIGGNLIEYPGNVSSPSADMTKSKLSWNSTISTRGARYMCLDVKNYYLGTPMTRYEYVLFALKYIPQEIIDRYRLEEIAVDGYVLAEVRKGMYGLPQAGKLAYDLLVKRLAPHGYSPIPHTDGLWGHSTRPILFSLVVDDFGVKYSGREHAEHLQNTLNLYYETTADWTGALYCGIHLKWDYDAGTVDLSMPGYVQAALKKYGHPAPAKPQHSPYPAALPQYGVKIQLTEPPDDSPALPPARIKRLQQIIGTFLYYARAVDPTMLMALSTLGSQQAHGTEQTERNLHHFLDYCHTHPSAIIRYKASNMILQVHSDASYLTEPGARSRVGGHFYLGNSPPIPGQQDILNGTLLTTTTIIRNVMSSAAEAELAALFHNARDAVSIRDTLHRMGHPQPPTPIATDNTTAHSIANDTCKQRRSKAMDMRFYWTKDRVTQRHIQVYWAPGKGNMADYHTKHHHHKHHMFIRPYYLYSGTATPSHIPMVLHAPPKAAAPPPAPPHRGRRVTWDTSTAGVC
jgi:hypothetical protein